MSKRGRGEESINSVAWGGRKHRPDVKFKLRPAGRISFSRHFLAVFFKFLKVSKKFQNSRCFLVVLGKWADASNCEMRNQVMRFPDVPANAITKKRVIGEVRTCPKLKTRL